MLFRRLLLLLLVLWSAPALADRIPPPPEREVPRVVLGLWDSHLEPNRRFSALHRFAEMPLNHLGLILRYHDLAEGPPPAEALAGLRGVVLWFPGNAPMADPNGLLDWLEQAMARNVRLVVLSDPNLTADLQGHRTPTERIERFWGWLGLKPSGRYIGDTFDLVMLHKEAAMVEFERPLTGALPGFDVMTTVDAAVHGHLVVRRKDDGRSESTLIATGPHGGYAAAD